jgi:hypothetical protein
MRKRVTATCEAVTRKAHVIAFVERFDERVAKVVKSSCRAYCVCCRHSETGSVDAMVLMGDSLIAEAARKVWAIARTNVEVWGEARRKVSVLAMDGLREPAEALKKKILLRGLRRAEDPMRLP